MRFAPLLLMLAAWLAVIVCWQYFAGRFSIMLWPVGMLVAVVLVFLCIYSCCKVRLLEALYWTCPVFIMAEFSASFGWQCYFYLYRAIENIPVWVQYVVVLFVCGGCAALAYVIEWKFISSHRAYVSVKDVVAVFAVGVIAFVVSNLYFIGGVEGDAMAIKIFEIRTLVDLCGVVLLYFYRIQRAWMQSKAEVNALQNVLHQQYAQYCLYKENEDAINRHYHDLKHQIDVILKEEDAGARKKYLEEMREALRMYDSENKTGNEVLDTVLTGKSMECVKDGITFTVVADGKLMDFMATMDICSIFGNALDNAIECVQKLEDEEKRLIWLSISAQDELVVVRIRNYFEEALHWRGGEIATAKSDRADHGYGLKSIRHTCEKYGGSMKVLAEQNMFTLCMLFPRTAKEESEL